MVFRIVRRLVLAGLLVFGFVVSSVAVAGYLATCEPSYYSQALTVQPTPADAEAAGERFERARRDFLQWRAVTAAMQKGGPRAQAIGAQFEAAPTHQLVATESELNAIIAAELIKLGDCEVVDPRVDFADGRLRVAFAVPTPVARLVLSAEFVPSVAPNGDLAMALDAAHVGRLPIPCELLASRLPRQRMRLKGDLYLDLTGAKPSLVADQAGANEDARITAIRCSEDDVTIEFAAVAQN